MKTTQNITIERGMNKTWRDIKSEYNSTRFSSQPMMSKEISLNLLVTRIEAFISDVIDWTFI